MQVILFIIGFFILFIIGIIAAWIGSKVYISIKRTEREFEKEEKEKENE